MLSKSCNRCKVVVHLFTIACMVVNGKNWRSGGPTKMYMNHLRVCVMENMNMLNGIQHRMARVCVFQQLRKLPILTCFVKGLWIWWYSMRFKKAQHSQKRWTHNCQQWRPLHTGGFLTCCRRARNWDHWWASSGAMHFFLLTRRKSRRTVFSSSNN